MPYTYCIFRTHGPHEYIKPKHTEIYYIYADGIYMYIYLHVGFYIHKHTYRLDKKKKKKINIETLI